MEERIVEICFKEDLEKAGQEAIAELVTRLENGYFVKVEVAGTRIEMSEEQTDEAVVWARLIVRCAEDTPRHFDKDLVLDDEFGFGFTLQDDEWGQFYGQEFTLPDDLELYNWQFKSRLYD
jgi:hypothetical protein